MTTSPSARGLGLCADLISRSLLLARALGYKAAKAEATGDFSRKAFLRLGFSEDSTMSFSRWPTISCLLADTITCKWMGYYKQQ